MDEYNQDFLNNNYNMNDEDDISPIEYTNESLEDKYLGINQNNGEMFGVFDEINQNYEEITKNFKETQKKQKLYEQRIKENFERLNQNHHNNYYINNNFDNNQYQFSTSSRQYEPNINISSDNNILIIIPIKTSIKLIWKAHSILLIILE